MMATICTRYGPTGWIAGADLRDASAGPFNALLERIGVRSRTTDRKTIAGSFALTFGWSAALPIESYLRDQTVLDVSLDNVAFKFNANAAFERIVLRETRTIATPGDPLRALRGVLVAQAEPVVDALYRWSGFARRGTWGQLTAAWLSQFMGAWPHADQRGLVPVLDAFFAGHDDVAAMRPVVAATADRTGVVRLTHRRASCCRVYLLPGGELCTSCPLRHIYMDGEEPA